MCPKRFAVRHLNKRYLEEIPGVFQLNDEGIHYACFYV